MARRPVRRVQGERVLADLGAIEEAVDASDEQPVPLDAAVRVVVADGLVDPAVAVLDLGLAVHVTRGHVVVAQVDLVGARVENGDADRGELGGERPTERLAARGVATDPRVGHEEVDEAIEVALVEADRIAGNQLPDVGLGEEAVEWIEAHESLPKRWSAQPPGVRPSTRTRLDPKRQAPSTRRYVSW